MTSLWLATLPILAQAGPAPVPAILNSIHIYWYILPLVASISLVYTASRYEEWPKIWWHSLRLAGAIFSILIVTTVVLLLINTQV